jgi:hypothetical protein
MTEHNHDHERTVAPMVDEITDFEVLEIALRELCIEKGIFTAEDHRRFTEFAEHIGPTPGAHLVSRAWLDPEFKKLALTDPIAASREVGVDWLEPTGFGTRPPFCTRAEDTHPHRHRVRAVLVHLDRSWATPRSGTAHPTTAGAVRWPWVLLEFASTCPKTWPSWRRFQPETPFWRAPVRSGTEGWDADQLAEIVTATA